MTAGLFAGCLLACLTAPPALPVPTPTPPVPSASPSVAPAPTPTTPPIIVTPNTATVAVGYDAVLRVGAVMGSITATADTALVLVAVDQEHQMIRLTGRAPGTTTMTVTDARGVRALVPVRVAYNAGAIADGTVVRITGDPADSSFVKAQAVAAALAEARVRPGAQIVASEDQVSFKGALTQDNVATVDVPVLIQGEKYLSVDGITHVRVINFAAPKITPDALLVSDFPEKLESNGVLFTADLRRDQPSRFLYFHYNPPGSPPRRIVLRAENQSTEPSTIQFIDGQGGPETNEMEVGHTSTKRFLLHLIQNEGRVITIGAKSSLNLVEQDLPAADIVSNLLQLRVLSGSPVHLTLVAQNASDSPDMTIGNLVLLEGGHPHARGVYGIPEFHYNRSWNVLDQYLELPIGNIPLLNQRIAGQALTGDYGVLQTFVINVQNPTAKPASIALYENPRGGSATGTYLIDNVLVQSHQVSAFSRYKIRQYVVPAKGFVRVTIATIPEAGSTYPLRLIFAPDDGSVPPGAPGSPIY